MFVIQSGGSSYRAPLASLTRGVCSLLCASQHYHTLKYTPKLFRASILVGGGSVINGGYNTWQHTSLHWRIINNSILYSILLYYTALHYIALSCTTLHSSALHCTLLHCPTLHYTILNLITINYTWLQLTKLDNTTLHCITLPKLYYAVLHCMKYLTVMPLWRRTLREL